MYNYKRKRNSDEPSDEFIDNLIIKEQYKTYDILKNSLTFGPLKISARILDAYNFDVYKIVKTDPSLTIEQIKRRYFELFKLI